MPNKRNIVTVDVGFDHTGTVRGDGTTYLPHDLSKGDQIDTHCNFRIGNRVNFRAFDISAIRTSENSPYVPLLLLIQFHRARDGQQEQSPFSERCLVIAPFASASRTWSVVFREELETWEVSPRVRVIHAGAFLASYSLFAVDTTSGTLRTFKTDPEWIVRQ